MALPYLFRKLFQNDGVGNLLNKEIIPPSYVDTVAQTFTEAQKAQARENIGATTASAVLNESTRLAASGSFLATGHTVAEVQNALVEWLNTTQYSAFATFIISGDSWIRLWNANDTTSKITGSSYFTVTKITASRSDYVSLLISLGADGRLYCVTRYNSSWSAIRQISMDVKADIQVDLTASRVIASHQSPNGDYWYRKYSDGWIEQGGTTQYWQNGSSTGYTTISLNTPYSGTNYEVMLTGTIKKGTTGGSGNLYYEEQTKTTTNFQVRKSNVDGLYVNWYTCGF